MIAIVTDSSACMYRKDGQALGITYIPMLYSLSGQSFADGYVDELGDFETRLQDGRDLRTSQPSTEAFMRAFFTLRQLGYEILCLTISSRLSGAYNNARNCARELGEEYIRVIDSHTAAGGLIILANAAQRMAAQGLSLGEIEATLNAMRSRLHIAFTVSDMEPLRRSGRLGAIRQSVVTILNRRPILFCRDGLPVSCRLVRGNQEMMSALVQAVPENAMEIYVHDLAAPTLAQTLEQCLAKKTGLPVHRRGLCAVLGVHLGLGIVGVVWLDPETTARE